MVELYLCKSHNYNYNYVYKNNSYFSIIKYIISDEHNKTNIENFNIHMTWKEIKDEYNYININVLYETFNEYDNENTLDESSSEEEDNDNTSCSE